MRWYENGYLHFMNKWDEHIHKDGFVNDNEWWMNKANKIQIQNERNHYDIRTLYIYIQG